MYKIEIQFEQTNKNISHLSVCEYNNKNTTKFEKVAGYILKGYIQKAVYEFNNEFKKDNDTKAIDELELDEALKDLLDDLKILKETMKDKKKED